MNSKEKILKILVENAGKEISGEAIAADCEISRAAVWKAVNSLRNEGVEIEGTNNRGYVLKEDADLISRDILNLELKNSFSEKNKSCGNIFNNDFFLEYFNTIDSTNTYCKKLLLQNQHVKNGIVVAAEQTGGRGRLGRSFFCPRKTGIYFSIIYTPIVPVSNPAVITILASVALSRAIKSVYGVDSSIKWINDLFVDGKKAAGILTEGFVNFETNSVDSVIVGIGLNISDNADLPAELKNVVGSVCGKNGGGYRCKIVSKTAVEFFSLVEEGLAPVLDEYKNLSFILGKEINVYNLAGDFSDKNRNYYTARAVDIDKDGALVVRLLDGSEKTLTSGEVSIGSASVAGAGK